MKNLKFAFVMCLLLITMLLASGCESVDELKKPVDPNDDSTVIIEIPPGSTTTKISNILLENELVRNKNIFKLIAQQMEVDNKMKAGKYELSKSMSVETIVTKISSGDVYQEVNKFTIPEGYETRQIIDTLVSKKLIDKEKFVDVLMNHDFDYKFLTDDVDRDKMLEGYLFPETYFVAKDADEVTIATKMLAQFDSIFKEEYYKRANELNMTVDEIITLASIIEREAMVDQERKIISSVFHNRLNIDMKLQSCATIQFVLGERKEKLYNKDLEIESDYNTYMYKGLPPNPIASPSEKSIIAALYPEKTEYLYFVAKNDNSGEHVFSTNLSDHNKAKEENR